MRLVSRGLLVVLLMTLAGASAAFAQLGVLYADSGPDIFGSPNWNDWWSAAKTDVVAGTFTDLRSGTYPGTDHIDALDEIVYENTNMGRRLQLIYKLPGVSTSGWEVQAMWEYDWGGQVWTIDWSNDGKPTQDLDRGWEQPGLPASFDNSKPGFWEDYRAGAERGVIGTFGFAFDVPEAELPSRQSEIRLNQTYARGLVRYRNSSSGGEKSGEWTTQEVTLSLNTVPEPSSIMLLGVVLGGSAAVAGLRRRRR
jgi:hypothetical protein